MALKYFEGAYAGNLGTSELRYIIHDHFLVRVDHPTKGTVKVFQVREKKGIIENDIWQEIVPEKVRHYDMDNGDYDEPAYYRNGERIPVNQLKVRYEVTDITELALGARAVEKTSPNSPYIPQPCLAIFESNYQITKRKKRWRPIIEAIEAKME